MSSTLCSILGDDPCAPKGIKVNVFPQVLKYWQHYSRKGNSKEDKDRLLNKYETPMEWSAPILNDQLLTKLKISRQRILKRDFFRWEAQRYNCAALSALGDVTTLIDDPPEEGLDKLQFMERVTDAARLVCEAIYQESVSRRTCICPCFEPELREILKKSEIDHTLFGENLAETIKKSKDAEKLLRGSNPKFPGNSRRPQSSRPPLNRTSSTIHGGQERPKLFFKKSFQGDQKRYPKPNQQSRGRGARRPI